MTTNNVKQLVPHPDRDNEATKAYIRAQAALYFPTLKLYTLQKFAVQSRENGLRLKELENNFGNVNLDTHTIVSNEQLDITNQIKALSGMVSTVQDIKEDVQFVKSIYTTNTTTSKKNKQKISDEEKGYAIRAKLLKIPKVKK